MKRPAPCEGNQTQPRAPKRYILQKKIFRTLKGHKKLLELGYNSASRNYDVTLLAAQFVFNQIAWSDTWRQNPVSMHPWCVADW